MCRWFHAARFAFLFAALAFLAMPRTAAALPPYVPTSDWPHHVLLVGKDASGVPDPSGVLVFNIRNVAGQPYSRGTIALDFTNVPGARLCVDQGNPAVRMVCDAASGHWVGYDTDALGHASFSIVGRIDHTVGGSHAPSLKIYVDGFFFGTVPVASIDEDGAGLGAADNSLWQADYFSNQYWERSDFDGDGLLGPSDLSVWLSTYFANGSQQSCTGSTCP